MPADPTLFGRVVAMILYIFLYNVIYIKSDFSKISLPDKHKMVLIGSKYCLGELSFKNRCYFEAIHEVSRDFHQVDQQEIEEILLHYLQKYPPENIRFLTNEDSTQLICANLRKKYNIPGLSADILLPFVDKVVSKEQLDNVVKMPEFVKFDKNQYANNPENYLETIANKLGFPLFAKPVDLVSSVETHYIDDAPRLKVIADRMLNHAYDFEVDEFIDGELFHCDAMIIDGAIKFFMIGKCSFALSRFFEGKPVGSIPIIDQTLFYELRVFCEKVFDKLHCPSGAYHVEVFLTKQTKELVFLEIGARTGGALITKVYEKCFDMNVEEVHYSIQMGLIDDVKVSKKDIFAGFLNFPKIKGKVISLEKPILDIEHEFIPFVSPGDVLEQAENLLDISCSIIFWDTSYEKVEHTFEFLKNYHPLKI